MRVPISIALLAVSYSAAVEAQFGSAERDVLAASDARLAAVFAKDGDALDRLQADDFVLVQDGVVLSKAEQIARVLAFDSPESNPARVVTVHNFSLERNVAIVTGVVTITINFNEFSSAFTEVWVRRGSSWLAKAAHYSTVDPTVAQ